VRCARSQRGWMGLARGLAVGGLVLGLAVEAGGCSAEPALEIALWEPPEGATLLGEFWGLRVYESAGAHVCQGTVDRAGRHWRALLDLLELDTLDGIVILYDENNGGDEALDPRRGRCTPPEATGCGGAMGAVTSAGALTHELAHHAVLRSLHRPRAAGPPYITEGLADLLSGWVALDYRMLAWRDDPASEKLPDLEERLRWNEVSSFDYMPAAHFVAWLFDEHGAEATLGMYDALMEPGDSRDEELALIVDYLGYESFAALEDAYLWGSAWIYPQVMDMDERYGVSDLEGGVPWFESCTEGAGRGTEGRNPRPGASVLYREMQATTTRLHSALVWLDRGVYGYVLEDRVDEDGPRYASPGLLVQVLEEPKWDVWYPRQIGGELCRKAKDTWATGKWEVEEPGWYRLEPTRNESTLVAYGGERPRLWMWRRGENCEDPAFQLYPPGGLPPPGSFPGP